MHKTAAHLVVVLLLSALSLPLWAAEAPAGSPTQVKPPLKQTLNHLKNESSPYLFKHATNPIDWYPWGPEAFEKARREDKPIWLSIGYSTCHWCNVMEEESYSDPVIGALMNETFVAIKVDREERPDIDSVYVNVSLVLTDSAGWPLNVIMTPDMKPFYVATYIPRTSRYDLVGLTELIPRVKDLWANNRQTVTESTQQVLTSLRKFMDTKPGEALSESDLHKTFAGLRAEYDPDNGGFGSSPKFPAAHNLLFLLRYAQRTGQDEALSMVLTTLDKMRQGGIYDHLGYGFHRYSTDEKWRVPHFEKMLTDQAFLSLAYLEAGQLSGDPKYALTAQEIFEYVQRDMRAPEGVFYTAEGADSEGREGYFYTWSEAELRELAGGRKDGDLAVKLYNVRPTGNYAEPGLGLFTGRNILYRGDRRIADIAYEMKISEESARTREQKLRKKLFTVRQLRVRPFRDDKVLTDGNALMIAALARGGRVLSQQKYTEAARRAMDFLLKNVVDEKGHLLHRWRKGDAAIMGNAHDYAAVVFALHELYETTYDVRYLREAIRFMDDFIARFWDSAEGGFYLTADNAEALLVRPRELYDGSSASSNSMAFLDLVRLGRLSARTLYEDRASDMSRAFSATIAQSPASYSMFMSAYDFVLGPAYEVVIVGTPGAVDTRAMMQAFNSRFYPNAVVLFVPAYDKNDEAPEVLKYAAYAKYMNALKGRATAYVCSNYQCKSPTTDPAVMLSLLSRVPARENAKP